MWVFTFFSVFLLLELDHLVCGQADRYDSEVVKVVLCFCEHLTFAGSSKVGHVGIEVRTASGLRLTIHNLGPKHASAQVDPIRQCDLERMRSPFTTLVKQITVGDLRRVAGSDYGINGNNCYHARNRMLRYIGKDIRVCPNPYEFESDQSMFGWNMNSLKTVGGIRATWCDSDAKYQGRSKCI